MLVRSIDIDFRKQRERCPVCASSEGFDLPFGPRLLISKLIARKAQNFKAIFLVFLVQLDELLVSDVGLPSLARQIYHQRYLAGES